MGLKVRYSITCDDKFCTNGTRIFYEEESAVIAAAVSIGFVLQPDGTWLCARCNSEKMQEKKEEA